MPFLIHPPSVRGTIKNASHRSTKEVAVRRSCKLKRHFTAPIHQLATLKSRGRLHRHLPRLHQGTRERESSVGGLQHGRELVLWTTTQTSPPPHEMKMGSKNKHFNYFHGIKSQSVECGTSVYAVSSLSISAVCVFVCLCVSLVSLILCCPLIGKDGGQPLRLYHMSQEASAFTVHWCLTIH